MPKDLFTPVRVGPFDLKNRVVMAPMTRSRWAYPDLVGRYYAQRAGAGLLVSESTSVGPLSVSRPHSSRMDDDSWIPLWAAAAETVHKANGVIFQQLYHLGRKSDPSRLPAGVQPIAPSAIAAKGQIMGVTGMIDFAVPRALDTDEVPGIVAEFRVAAVRAKAAGLDGVELHGANCYIVDQFLRDGANKRTDRYGGSIANRARFVLEVVDALTDVFGADRVGVRVSPHALGDGISDSDPVSLFGHVAEQLNARHIAYLHLVEADGYGIPNRSPAPGTPLLMPVVRAAFAGPLIVCGGYTRASADAVIAAGRADLVAFGNLFIGNPDLVKRLCRNGPYNQNDSKTVYGGGAEGYIDYPTLG